MTYLENGAISRIEDTRVPILASGDKTRAIPIETSWKHHVGEVDANQFLLCWNIPDENHVIRAYKEKQDVQDNLTTFNVFSNVKKF